MIDVISHKHWGAGGRAMNKQRILSAMAFSCVLAAIGCGDSPAGASEGTGGMTGTGVNGTGGGFVDDTLPPGSVGTEELEDEAVTNAKLAPNAVGTLQIEDGAVTASKLSADAVDPRMFVSSATALVNSFAGLPLPQSTDAVLLSLDPSGSDPPQDGQRISSGLIEIQFEGRLMAMVSMRLTPTGAPTTAQCRLYRRLDGQEAISAMTNHIPRLPIPAEGVATSLVGVSSVAPGTYDVSLRCGAGFSGGAPLATLNEAQLIVWALAN